MIKKPGIKNKEGLQISGIYLLIIAGVAQYIFPDVEHGDIQAVAQWYREQDIDLNTAVKWITDGSIMGYLANRLRLKNDKT